MNVLGGFLDRCEASCLGDQGFLLDEPPNVIIEGFFVSLEALEVFYGVRVKSPEALEVLSELRL